LLVQPDHALQGEEAMKAWKIGGFLAWMGLAAVAPASAQAPIFVDGAILTDQNWSESINGAALQAAGRAAVGFNFSGSNGFRFELDVPAERSRGFTSTDPIYCAPASNCGPGTVPARSLFRHSERVVSYSFLYARRFPAVGRVQLTLLAGGAVEDQRQRTISTTDELNAAGEVVRHSGYDFRADDVWAAAVVGLDAEVGVTERIALVPQVRFHTFPYPPISIIRPGLAVRWRF
jgi:hypothetical protein